MQDDWDTKLYVWSSPVLFLRKLDQHAWLLFPGARNHHLFGIFCKTVEKSVPPPTSFSIRPSNKKKWHLASDVCKGGKEKAPKLLYFCIVLTITWHLCPTLSFRDHLMSSDQVDECGLWWKAHHSAQSWSCKTSMFRLRLQFSSRGNGEEYRCHLYRKAVIVLNREKVNWT